MLIEVKEAPRRISLPSEAAQIFRSILSFEDEIDQCKEHFWAIGLNIQHVVLYIDLVTLGTLSNSLVHPREVFRMAIFKAASSILVGHNHPSGDVQPSMKDRQVTRNLWQAGNILDIPVIDHVIIANGNDKYFSFEDKGHLIKYAREAA